MVCPHQLCKASALVRTSRMVGSKKLRLRQGGCGRCYGAIPTPFQVPRPQSGGRSTAHKADLGDTPMLHLQRHRRLTQATLKQGATHPQDHRPPVMSTPEVHDCLDKVRPKRERPKRAAALVASRRAKPSPMDATNGSSL